MINYLVLLQSKVEEQARERKAAAVGKTAESIAAHPTHRALRHQAGAQARLLGEKNDEITKLSEELERSVEHYERQVQITKSLTQERDGALEARDIAQRAAAASASATAAEEAHHDDVVTTTASDAAAVVSATTNLRESLQVFIYLFYCSRMTEYLYILMI